MATVYVWLDDMVGVPDMHLWLRKADGSLVNVDGAELTDPSSTGRFQATFEDSLTGLGTLRARVSNSSEEADVFFGGWLADGAAIVIDDYPSGGLTNEEAEQLAEVHAGLFPEDPEASPLVVSPSPPDTTTGWLVVCQADSSLPQPGVQVSCRCIEEPANDYGTVFLGTIRTETSDDDGLVQWPGLRPGATYCINSGSRYHTFTIPADYDAGTYQLPSMRV